jgi:hypothetical protein
VLLQRTEHVENRLFLCPRGSHVTARHERDPQRLRQIAERAGAPLDSRLEAPLDVDPEAIGKDAGEAAGPSLCCLEIVALERMHEGAFASARETDEPRGMFLELL